MIEFMENKHDETIVFKTNINCSGCIAKVAPALNQAYGISHWEVDTASLDRILTVSSKGITEDEILKAVQNAGFKIEVINQ